MSAPAARLLAWYDRHARDLPWRSDKPDPYRVWLSEIMLQQTTTAAVAPYYEKFLARWPDARSLAAAEDADVMHAWAGLGYYARARNLLACARQVRDAHGGRFPESEEGLRGLPGIGAYTAAAIAAIAFGRRAVVVDGNVERVVSRLFAIETPLPASRPQIRARTDELTPDSRPGDFAQAMMDLGATICTPTRPACILCPLNDDCSARRAGLQTELPRRLPKAERPMRFGAVFVGVRDDGAVLLQTRPAKGLLGGMTEFPGVWPIGKNGNDAGNASGAPVAATWREAGRAYHGFTHFDLELQVFRADVAAATIAQPPLRWVLPVQLGAEPFPALMRKVASAGGLNLAPLSAGRARAPEPARALRETVRTPRRLPSTQRKR